MYGRSGQAHAERLVQHCDSVEWVKPLHANKTFGAEGCNRTVLRENEISRKLRKFPVFIRANIFHSWELYFQNT